MIQMYWLCPCHLKVCEINTWRILSMVHMHRIAPLRWSAGTSESSQQPIPMSTMCQATVANASATSRVQLCKKSMHTVRTFKHQLISCMVWRKLRWNYCTLLADQNSSETYLEYMGGSRSSMWLSPQRPSFVTTPASTLLICFKIMNFCLFLDPNTTGRLCAQATLLHWGWQGPIREWTFSMSTTNFIGKSRVSPRTQCHRMFYLLVLSRKWGNGMIVHAYIYLLRIIPPFTHFPSSTSKFNDEAPATTCWSAPLAQDKYDQLRIVRSPPDDCQP